MNIKSHFFILLVLSIYMIFLAPSRAIGAFQTNSNTWSVKVGNPPALSGIVCPIREGKITCGPSRPTYTNYSSSCSSGHCAGNYGSYSWCGTDERPTAEHFAIDVPGKAFEDVFLPSLTFPNGEVHPLTCLYAGAAGGTYNSDQRIFAFSCKDDVNPTQSIWIQFHHSNKNYVPKSNYNYRSGEAVTKVDPDLKENFPHTHVQIGINGVCKGYQTTSCVPADRYLQCK